ncbi:hypothetical protein FTV88_3191 [Heliorestis convoluta]|uniref:Uncharacterized protein n=1 Tax=Heliorestis convoluta TaxID=356322 RepID=A0A5Q2N368_9FIRM|nr:hypothetical protein FTV88_3191 [Heliorestis convoluta]
MIFQVFIERKIVLQAHHVQSWNHDFCCNFLCHLEDFVRKF